MRVEITGAIGSGKSSLAKLLLDHGFEVVFEEFKMNPFWKAFYSNPSKYNFETEVTFLLQHYHDLKRKLEEADNVICDFSFTQDLGYAVMGLNQSQLAIFRSIYNYIISEFGEPSLIVYLKCSPRKLIERIRLRGRSEETLIDEGFLDMLSKYVTQEISLKRSTTSNIEFWEIDTEKVNFISNHSDQAFVLEKISRILAV